MNKEKNKQLAEMPGTGLRENLLVLTPAERAEIKNYEVLKARGEAILKKKVDNINATQDVTTRPLARVNKT